MACTCLCCCGCCCDGLTGTQQRPVNCASPKVHKGKGTVCGVCCVDGVDDPDIKAEEDCPGTWVVNGRCKENPCGCTGDGDCQLWCEVSVGGVAGTGYCDSDAIEAITGCIYDGPTLTFSCIRVFANFSQIPCDEDDALLEYVAEIAATCPNGESDLVVSISEVGYCCDGVCQSAPCNSGLAVKVTRVPPAGPGTELKKILAGFPLYIKVTPSCPCNARAKVMDKNEREHPGWCEENIDTIVGWLREEHAKRKSAVPFIDMAVKKLIRIAIKRAKRGNSQ